MNPVQHEQEFHLNELISSVALNIRNIPPDPSLSKDLIPRALVVGSYARRFLLKEAQQKGSDLDIEIYGVSSDYLLQELPNLECFQGKIQRIEERGNTYKVATITLVDGTRIDFTIPLVESKTPQRYSTDGLVESPEATPGESWARKRFAHECLGYDPITGEVIDPYSGLDDLKDKVLTPVSKWITQDPVNLPFIIHQIADGSWQASDELTEKLIDMILHPGNRTRENYDDFRFKYEISLWFLSNTPTSFILEKAKELGFIDVYVPNLKILSKSKFWQNTLEMIDLAHKESTDQNEAIKVGRQIGVLYAGIIKTEEERFGLLSEQERMLLLTSLTLSLYPASIAPREDAHFEQVMKEAKSYSSQFLSS